MKTHLFSIAFVFFSLSAWAKDCKPVETKIARFDGPAVTEQKTLCRHEDFWSEAGWEKWRETLANKPIEARAEGFASPGLKVCESLGGKAVSAKFFWEGKERSHAFCSFAKKGWVSIDWLENYRNPKRRGR